MGRHAKPDAIAKASRTARTAVYAGGVTTAAAAAALGLPAIAAHAATVTASATTALHARPDSGSHGNTWANDSMTRTATIALVGADSTLADCGVTAPAQCFTYTGTITDTGTAFAVTGARSPGAAGALIMGTPTAKVTGNATVTFHASSDDPDASLVPAAVSGGNGVSTTDWVQQFFGPSVKFGNGPDLTTWAWSYNDAKDCQQWTDAFNNGDGADPADGDITGTDSCVTSVAAIAPQTVTVGTPYSLQAHGSTTSSDKALAYKATGLPDGLSVNASTGVISGTPAKDAVSGSATVTVTDFGGVAASTTVAFSVQQAAPVPVTVVLSGGHVVAGTLLPTRAVVAWTATPAAPGGYSVTIVGPNFPGGRTGVVHVTEASYEGLASRHTYAVYVTPLDAHGKPDGATGHVTLVTP